MPELQHALFGPPASPAPILQSENRACGRCGVTYSVSEMVAGPDESYYCPVCFDAKFRACSLCHRFIDRDNDGVVTDSGDFFCDSCYSRHYTQCEACGRELCRSSGDIRGAFGDYYCSRCFDRRFYTCSSCDEVHERNDRYRNPNGDSICEDCFDRDCVTCEGCGEPIWANDARFNGERPYCHDCYRHTNEWDMGFFSVQNPTFATIGSTRKYGVELETSVCPNHHELNGNTIWECKHDCSIEGMEFVSPVLYGDEGLAEIVKFCREADYRHFEVNRHCGFHAHFDVSGDSEEALKAIAYAYRRTYRLWNELVPVNRSDNRYCGEPDYCAEDIIREEWDYFVGKRDRFEFVNWRSYLVHGSVEVRLYQGTLDASEVCNWVRLHARFIDFVSGMTPAKIDEMFGTDEYGISVMFAALTNIVGNELGDYWARKSRDAGKCVRELVQAEPIPPRIARRGVYSRTPQLDRFVLDDITESQYGNHYIPAGYGH